MQKNNKHSCGEERETQAQQTETVSQRKQCPQSYHGIYYYLAVRGVHNQNMSMRSTESVTIMISSMRGFILLVL